MSQPAAIPEVDATSDAVVVHLSSEYMTVTLQLDAEAAQEFSTRVLTAALRVVRTKREMEGGRG